MQVRLGQDNCGLEDVVIPEYIHDYERASVESSEAQTLRFNIVWGTVKSMQLRRLPFQAALCEKEMVYTYGESVPASARSRRLIQMRIVNQTFPANGRAWF